MYILDTNVVSELRKVRLGKADKRVARWADGVDASALYLSVITIGELKVSLSSSDLQTSWPVSLFNARTLAPAFTPMAPANDVPFPIF